MPENEARTLIESLSPVEKRILHLILSSKDMDKAYTIALECIKMALEREEPLTDEDIPLIAQRIAESV